MKKTYASFYETDVVVLKSRRNNIEVLDIDMPLVNRESLKRIFLDVLYM
jgi:hypothetical protein